MAIEYEATFPNINKDEIRGRLKTVGARLIRPEFLQRRYNFSLPGEEEIKATWLRVRDEGNRITMSLKSDLGKDSKITDQREICLQVDDLEKAKFFLEALGCKTKAYQETKRELWQLQNTEITLDEWPFLEPLVEIEGQEEAEVRVVAEKLGFDWSTAVFGSVTLLYIKKYNLSGRVIANRTPRIVFDMENPFV